MGELDAQVLAHLYSSADRRVRVLVRISKQSVDTAGVGVHAGKDYPDVLATKASGSERRVVGLARPWRGSGWFGFEGAGKITILIRNDRFRC